MARDSFTVELHGADALARALVELGVKLERKILARNIRKGAKLILFAAVAKAPLETGFLKRSLKIKAAKKRKKGHVSINVVTSSGKDKIEGFYGAFQEFGTSRIPPQGFVRGAWDENKRQALDTIMKGIWLDTADEAVKLYRGSNTRIAS